MVRLMFLMSFSFLLMAASSVQVAAQNVCYNCDPCVHGCSWCGECCIGHDEEEVDWGMSECSDWGGSCQLSGSECGVGPLGFSTDAEPELTVFGSVTIADVIPPPARASSWRSPATFFSHAEGADRSVRNCTGVILIRSFDQEARSYVIARTARLTL